MQRRSLSRRDILKLCALSLGSLALRPWGRRLFALPDFPQAERLGRVTKGTLEIKARPDSDSKTVGLLYEDNVTPWLRDVIGDKSSFIFQNQRWVETPDGYVYGPLFQPVRNLPNEPIQNLPKTSLGLGMWVEVTVPYVDVFPESVPSSNSWVKVKLEEGLPLRFYYSQVFWVDQIKVNEQGNILYRVNPNYYGGVDMLWGDAKAFRPIPAEEMTPINLGVEDKRMEVDVNHQIL